jgi:hypothetical protein
LVHKVLKEQEGHKVQQVLKEHKVHKGLAKELKEI